MNQVRRITLATLIGGIAAGVGFKAFGHGPMDLGRMLKHLYVEIDATEEQRQRLEPIVKEVGRELLPLREKLHAARREAIELLSQDRVDASALEALRAKQIGLADAASRRLTRAITDASEVLTPAQRKALVQRLARRHHRWHA